MMMFAQIVAFIGLSAVALYGIGAGLALAYITAGFTGRVGLNWLAVIPMLLVGLVAGWGAWWVAPFTITIQ